MVGAYQQKIFSGQKPVFDGRKNLYSRDPLPIGRDKVIAVGYFHGIPCVLFDCMILDYTQEPFILYNLNHYRLNWKSPYQVKGRTACLKLP